MNPLYDQSHIKPPDWEEICRRHQAEAQWEAGKIEVYHAANVFREGRNRSRKRIDWTTRIFVALFLIEVAAAVWMAW
ncbi:MAG: hypothetical protein WB608_16190 [Terracidiphilus sp.]